MILFYLLKVFNIISSFFVNKTKNMAFVEILRDKNHTISIPDKWIQNPILDEKSLIFNSPNILDEPNFDLKTKFFFPTMPLHVTVCSQMCSHEIWRGIFSRSRLLFVYYNEIVLFIHLQFQKCSYILFFK